MTYINEHKLLGDDNTTVATIITNADDDTNLDGENGLVASSMLYGRIDATKVKPLRIDASSHSIQIISYEHHEIHSSKHYFIEDVFDLSINQVYDVQWTTPNTTEEAHFVFELNCESETEWYIYEGATISTAGTAITPKNNNRNSLNTSNATIAGILNADLADANTDTPVAAATMLAHGIVVAGKSGGIINRFNELILKSNTIYCMRAIANVAGYINFLMSWYEHTPKD